MLDQRLPAIIVLAALATGCLDQSEVTPAGERTPDLQLSVTELAFTALAGGAAPADRTLTVVNGGGGTLAKPVAAVTLATGAGWLTADVSGAEAPYTVTLRVAPGALPVGTYTGEVRLESAGARRPRTIAVTFTVAASRTVSVSRQVTHWTEAGAGTPRPDAAVLTVTLQQEDGAGGFSSVTPTQGPPGTWTGVIKPGPYWAVIARTDGTQTWVRASAASLDLGADVAGRADVVKAGAGTTATLDLRALKPWDGLNDALSLVSYGAQGGALLDVATTPAVPLAAGAVDLVGFAFDWSAAVGPLLAPGDQLWLTQLRFRSNAAVGLDYQETTRFSSITGLSMTSGAPVALAAPDARPVTGTSQLLLDWRRSQFENALPPSTSDSLTAHAVTVSAIPARLEAPSPFGTWAVPLLLAFRGLTSQFDPDFSAGSLPYGTFLPGTWNVAFNASLTLDVTRTAPGATTAAPGLRDHVLRTDAIASAPDPVVPRIGGVLAPTIDGADALQPQTGLTTTPRLAWSAPATGTATAYLVELQQLVVNGTATEARPVALFVLDGTSLTIPAGLLERGSTYLAKLVARSNPADAGGASAFRVGVPYGEAAYWTEAFTTAP